MNLVARILALDLPDSSSDKSTVKGTLIRTRGYGIVGGWSVGFAHGPFRSRSRTEEKPYISRQPTLLAFLTSQILVLTKPKA